MVQPRLRHVQFQSGCMTIGDGALFPVSLIAPGRAKGSTCCWRSSVQYCSTENTMRKKDAQPYKLAVRSTATASVGDDVPGMAACGAANGVAANGCAYFHRRSAKTLNLNLIEPRSSGLFLFQLPPTDTRNPRHTPLDLDSQDRYLANIHRHPHESYTCHLWALRSTPSHPLSLHLAPWLPPQPRILLWLSASPRLTRALHRCCGDYWREVRLELGGR